MRLENQRALVTGGATGIGEAIVRLFVEEGASVLVADMVKERRARLWRRSWMPKAPAG